MFFPCSWDVVRQVFSAGHLSRVASVEFANPGFFQLKLFPNFSASPFSFFPRISYIVLQTNGLEGAASSYKGDFFSLGLFFIFGHSTYGTGCLSPFPTFFSTQTFTFF